MISVKAVEDKKIWEEWNLARENPSFLQSWAWGDFQEKIGREVFRIGVFENEKLVGICLLIAEKARTANFFYVPQGPLFENWSQDHLHMLLTFINDLVEQKSVTFLRFDPRIVSDKEAQLITEAGFIPAPGFIQPQTTAVIDLKKSEGDLQRALSSSTRYNINMGERRGVKIRPAKEKEIESFGELLMSTAKKKKLTLQEGDYHKNQYEALHEQGIMEMMVAEFNTEILAAALVVFYGKTAFYLHAANSYEHSDLRASYSLVWKSILEAKKRGCETFDFWGVAKDDSPKDPWAGVTAFKMSFGPERLSYQLPFDLPFSSDYKWTRFVEKYRRTLRSILRFGR